MGGIDGPRACRSSELASAVDLLNHVFRGPAGNTEGPARPPDLGWAYSFVYHPENLENLRVVCHRGRVVSLVAIHATDVRTPRGVLRVGGICGVATHPDYRGSGLSTATLHDADAQMRATRRHVGLLGTSIHEFYRARGWERAGQMGMFTLDRRNVALLPAASGADLQVTGEWRPHIAALCRLHNARLPAAERTPQLMATLLERRAPDVLVCLRRGDVVAYCARRDTRVAEHAGAPEDVITLLRHLLANPPDLAAAGAGNRQRREWEVGVVVPEVRRGHRVRTDVSTVRQRIETSCEHVDDAAGGDLASLMTCHGIPSSLGYIGMVKLLDVPGLFSAFDLERQVVVESTGQEGGFPRWRLHHQGHVLTLSEHELIKLLFGPERWPGFAPELFPLDFFQWPLDRV